LSGFEKPIRYRLETANNDSLRNQFFLFLAIVFFASQKKRKKVCPVLKKPFVIDLKRQKNIPKTTDFNTCFSALYRRFKKKKKSLSGLSGFEKAIRYRLETANN
jgi:hypothetical protein